MPTERTEEFDFVTIDEVFVPQIVQTKDGVSYVIETEDIISLTEEQFNQVKSEVLKRTSSSVEKNGVDIKTLTHEQVEAILDEILNIVGNSENPFADGLINLSGHVQFDHMNNPSLLKDRGWYHEDNDEIRKEIVSAVKEAFDVEKAKLKFNPKTKKTKPTFTFTILGYKRNKDKGKLSVVVIKDSEDSVLVVTIL
ncbi:hypothetical protein ACLQ7P_17155 [Bacillus subtilis subsp. subtilis]